MNWSDQQVQAEDKFRTGDRKLDQSVLLHQRSKPAVKPELLVEHLAQMQDDARFPEPDLRRRIGVEVAAAKTGAAVAGFHKTLPVAGKLPPLSLARNRLDNVVRYPLRFVVREHASLGQRFTDGGKHDSGHVTDCMDAGEPGFERAPVYGDPAAFTAHSRIADHLGGARG